MRFIRPLYMQVLIAVVLGCLFGHFAPSEAVTWKWVADFFIALITMLISPIVFCTIVVGIGTMTDLKKVGKVGLKALIYFEAATTAALILGLVVVNLVRPGAGIHASAASLDASAISSYAAQGEKLTVIGFFMDFVPATVPSALVSGKILQVLLVSILVGVALVGMGVKGRPITDLVDLIFKVMMRIVNIVILLAPLAAFAAMAFVVGRFGLHSLLALGKLMACVYGTMLAFIVLVMGAVLQFSGIALWRLVRYLREEIWLVVGTSSSETALPGLMTKLENLGCSKQVVGLVVPAGYSFNLDGTCIYLTMAAIFIGQATDTPLTLWDQIGMLLILLLTSKGAAAVTGGGFITLAATLKGGGMVPVAGLSLILGVDRFMSQARALTNLMGNAVAVITVAGWENEFDRKRAQQVLAEVSENP